MSRSGRYIELFKVGSHEVVLELRIVDFLSSDVGLGLPSYKWLLPKHWDEVYKIVTKTVAKHIELNNQTEEECDDIVNEIEGEHVKIAYFFKPYVAAYQYMLCPYRSNVSGPAEALKSEVDWLCTRPYPNMLIAAVAPRYTKEQQPSGTTHLEYNKQPLKAAPGIVPESDDDTCYSGDSHSDQIEQEFSTLVENNSNVSVASSNHLISKSVQVGSKSAANSVYSECLMSGSDADEDSCCSQVTGNAAAHCNTRTSTPNRQDDEVSMSLSGNEDHFAENMNHSSQYVSITKVSKYTGQESVVSIHKHDLTYTQTLFELEGATQVQSVSSDPIKEGLDEEMKTANYSDSSSSLNFESSPMFTQTAASSAKPRRRGSHESKRKSRRKCFLESPSTHTMSVRCNSPCTSPDASQSSASSQLSETQETTFSVCPEAEEKHVKKPTRMLLVDEKDVYKGRWTGKGTPNGHCDKTDANGSSMVDMSSNKQNIASSPGATGYSEGVCSKKKSKVSLSLKSSMQRKKGKLCALEICSESHNCLDSSHGTRSEKQESSMGHSLMEKHAKCSDNDDIIESTPDKQRTKMQSQSKTDRKSKKLQFVNTRNRRHREKKLEQNRMTETPGNLNNIKLEKIGNNSDTLLETETGKQKRKKSSYKQEVYEDSSGSEVPLITSGEISRTLRRSTRLRSFTANDSEKCARGTQDRGSCSFSVDELAAPKETNAQKFSMEDLSLSDLETMFRENISYLKEINRGIRPSKRHDCYQNGGLRDETLVYAVSISPFSTEQVRYLSQLCRTEFCHTLEERIGLFSYITRVLIPDLCTKLFMDRFHMNEEEALGVIDKTYIHIPRKDNA